MDANEVQELLDSGWTKEKLAARCFVTVRTVENWQKHGCWTPGRMWFLKDLLKDSRKKATRK